MNAIIGWIFTLVVTIAAAVSFLSNEVLWGVFSLLVATVVALPAIATREWTAMVPWPLPSVAAIATTVRMSGFYPEIAVFTAISTLALVIIVELTAFAPIHLSRRFAVGFSVLTTMAIEALWIIAQFTSDRWLGTAFLTTQTELQEDIVTVTVVGFVMGGLFYWYFARFEPAGPTFGSPNREGPS